MRWKKQNQFYSIQLIDCCPFVCCVAGTRERVRLCIATEVVWSLLAASTRAKTYPTSSWAYRRTWDRPSTPWGTVWRALWSGAGQRWTSSRRPIMRWWRSIGQRRAIVKRRDLSCFRIGGWGLGSDRLIPQLITIYLAKLRVYLFRSKWRQLIRLKYIIIWAIKLLI